MSPKTIEATPVTRPPYLPDYQSPPLNEFYLGIQFAQPVGYQQIYAGEVWSLFSGRYPIVQEYSPLPPSFETFGLPNSNTVNFGMITGAVHDRFWFLSTTGSDLLQFQNDKFIHNWRNLRVDGDKYPRFEYLIGVFEEEARELERYFTKFGQKELVINQCEISYINHIRPTSDHSVEPSAWLRFIDFGKIPVDDFRAGFRRTIFGDNGRALGRVTCEAATTFDPDGTPFIALTLTAKGAPEAQTLDGALAFLLRSRELLVRMFAEVTTDAAQRIWGKL